MQNGLLCNSGRKHYNYGRPLIMNFLYLSMDGNLARE